MRYHVEDKILNIYNFAQSSSCPLIIVQAEEKEASELIRECLKLSCRDFVLAAVGNIDWNRDLSPWPAAAVFSNSEPFAGEANDYLEILEKKIIPTVRVHLSDLKTEIKWIGLAGYSLAGLFALYAGCASNCFNRLVSASGSLWYPGLLPYIRGRGLKDNVEKIYLSLGDKESDTRNQLLAEVERRTEEVYELLKDQVEIRYELNEGNHFKDPSLRLAKGIAYILQDQ